MVEKCKTSIGSNSGSVKHSQEDMGFWDMADARMVWPSSLSRDRK